MTISVHQLGKVGVDHLKQADFFHLSDQIGSFTGLNDSLLDAAWSRRMGAAQNGQVPETQQTFDDLVVDVDAICLVQLGHDSRYTVLRMLARDLLQDGQQVGILLRVVYLVPLVIIPSRLGQIQGDQRSIQANGVLGRFHQGHLLAWPHLVRPKKFFKSAISTSFWPSNRSSSAIRPSYSTTMLSWAKTSAPFSRKVRLHALTVLGWIP